VVVVVGWRRRGKRGGGGIYQILLVTLAILMEHIVCLAMRRRKSRGTLCILLFADIWENNGTARTSVAYPSLVFATRLVAAPSLPSCLLLDYSLSLNLKNFNWSRRIRGSWIGTTKYSTHVTIVQEKHENRATNCKLTCKWNE
jgi:hypothetical protein